MLDTRPAPWAVVVDDRDDDAMGILNALSQLKIPAVRYDGDQLMPEEPLPHVRLLFLDLDLGGGSFDIKRTAGVVFQILSPTISSGPCLIVLWTAHGDEYINFKQALERYNSSYDPENQIRPLDIIYLSKQDYWENADDAAISYEDTTAPKSGKAYAFQSIKDRLAGTLDNYKNLGLLVHWEALNATAASRTTARLFYASIPTGDNPKNQEESLENVFKSLARASIGKKERTAEEATLKRAVFEVLSMLQADMVQRLATNQEMDIPFGVASSLGEREEMAALNTIILTAAEAHSNLPTPGAVIMSRDIDAGGFPFAESSGDRAYRGLVCNIFKKEYDKNKSTILGECRLVFIEITPGCDHAQDKRRMLRFIPGLLIPTKLIELLPMADHLRKIYPLLHDGTVVALVLDAAHFFTLPLNVTVPKPIFRLRDHVRTDIQAWLGGQLARPGHISLDS